MLKHQNLQMFGPKLNYLNMRNISPVEVVGRGSVTHLQIGENLNYLNYLIYHFKG